MRGGGCDGRSSGGRAKMLGPTATVRGRTVLAFIDVCLNRRAPLSRPMISIHITCGLPMRSQARRRFARKGNEWINRQPHGPGSAPAAAQHRRTLSSPPPAHGPWQHRIILTATTSVSDPASSTSYLHHDLNPADKGPVCCSAADVFGC